MNWNKRMSWGSHLLAVIAGVVLWQAVAKKTVKAQTKPSNAPVRVVSRDPAEAEVLSRLGALQEEDKQSVGSIEEVKESKPSEEKSKTLLEERMEEQVELAKELEAIIKRSEDFRKVEDLRMPLMEALLKEDENDAAAAIFIEWYRRDPVAAFDELAARPSWSLNVLRTQALVEHLTPDVLLNQLEARNRSSDFKDYILESLADHWVRTDDLRSLSAAYDKLGGTKANSLMEKFLDGHWVPRDGATALAYVSTGMSPSCRNAFLTKLLEIHSGDPSREWTEGIAASLIRETLGEEQVAKLRKEVVERDSRPGSFCDGGGGDDSYLTDHESLAKRMTQITPENESDMLGYALERLLRHGRDYPELFGAGKLSADEIFQEMVSQIPGGKDRELGLRRELYQKLANWNPKAAVEWASAHLSEADLLSATMKLDGMAEDPRASRMLELMENLPLKFEDGGYVGYAPLNFHQNLQDWQKLDADAANQALSRSPKAKEIVEKSPQKPASEESENYWLPMPDDEPIYYKE